MMVLLVLCVHYVNRRIYIYSKYVYRKIKTSRLYMLQRESIPEKILDMMDKYTNEERALAVKLDDKIYVIVTRGIKIMIME